MIFEALDNILSESNQASFDSLQEVGVGSQAVLMNAESFGLFAARVLSSDEDMRPGQVVNITGENMGMFIPIIYIAYIHVHCLVRGSPQSFLSCHFPYNINIISTTVSLYCNSW